MKILIAIILCVELLSACKSDHNNETTSIAPRGESILKATIRDTNFTFNKIFVERVKFSKSKNAYTDLIVMAGILNAADQKIEFQLEHLQVGSETLYFFSRIDNQTVYDNDQQKSDFKMDVAVNEKNHIKGTFGGILYDKKNADTLSIENGSFDIYF